MTDSELQDQLRTIRRACDVGPLKGEDLERYWVDTDAVRDRMSNVRHQIRQELEQPSHRHILLYGHRGSGKSTELNRLEEELGSSWSTIRVDILKELNPYDPTAAKIVFVIISKVAEYAQLHKLTPDEKALEGVMDFVLGTTTITTSDEREAKLAAEFGIDTSGSLLAKLVALTVKLKGDIQYASKGATTRVTEALKRPADLVANANALIESVRKSIRDEKRDLDLVVMVENIDKLDLALFRTIFYDNPGLINGLSISTIFTIPVFAVHSPDAGRLRASFDLLVSLPMIKVNEPNGDPCEAGRAVLRDIIAKRISPEHFPDALAHRLVEKSGGMIRLIMEVLDICVSVTKASLPITDEVLDYAIGRKRSDFRQEIVLPHDPPEDLKSASQLYDHLETLARRHDKGELVYEAVDPIDQILLQSGALCEYNGERWFDVHPLVRDILKHLGRL